MTTDIRLRHAMAAFLLAVLPVMGHAEIESDSAALPTTASIYTSDVRLVHTSADYSQLYMLAANDSDALPGQTNIAPAVPAAKFEPPLISGRKAHLYFGLGTIVLAGLTAMTAPNTENNKSSQPRATSGTTHTRLARATGVFAAATLATGLIYHWDDIQLEDGFTDPDVMHATLAGTGALMMLYAINKSMKSTTPTSHAGLAIAGAGAMLVAIKLTW